MQKDSTELIWDEDALRKGWVKTWLASSIAWLIVILLLSAIPTDPKNRQLLGFSTNRLLLFGLAVFIWLGHLLAAYLANRKPTWQRRFLDHWVVNKNHFRAGTVSLGFIAFVVWVSVFIYNNYTHPIRVIERYAAFYERLFPFFVGFFLECTFLIFGLLVMRFGLNRDELRKEKPVWSMAIWIYVFFIGVLLLVMITGIGRIPDQVGWGDIGIPVLSYQVLFAWSGGIILLVLIALPKKSLKPWGNRVLDFTICLALWASAVWIWSGMDVQRSFFAPSPRPPNFEVYPYSDAAYYDYNAQSLLLGYGLPNGQVVPRPLYILLLAGFHAIGGQGYEQTIYIQTLLLAVLPVFLYLLGKSMHSRGLGLALGILAIFREVNSINATPWVEVSHSKLYMADLPTTVAVIALAWLTVDWLTDAKRKWSQALWVGGVLGIAALLRTQVLFLLPGILLLTFWYYRGRWKSFFKVTGLLILGIGLVLAPWLARNWVSTGSLAFDDPATQNALIAQRYSAEIGGMPVRLPGETAGDYSERLSNSIRQYIIANPDIVARFVSTHFVHNFVSTALILPMHLSIDQRCDTLSVCTPFWISLTDNLRPSDIILLLLNLAVVSIGIASAYRRIGAAGMTPLLFLVIYSLSNALARNSARRYILPVDWVGYLYLLIGLFEIIFWTLILFGANRERIRRVLTPLAPAGPEKIPATPWVKIGITSLVLLGIGSALPLIEAFSQPHLQVENKTQVLSELLASPTAQSIPLTPQVLQKYSELNDVVGVKGRAFYPRYYRPLEGEPGSGWPAFKPDPNRQTEKIGFVLVGPQGIAQVSLALDSLPNYLPNASDVLILGCQEEGYIDALVVAFTEGENPAILRSNLEPLSCPFQ